MSFTFVVLALAEAMFSDTWDKQPKIVERITVIHTSRINQTMLKQSFQFAIHFISIQPPGIYKRRILAYTTNMWLVSSIMHSRNRDL